MPRNSMMREALAAAMLAGVIMIAHSHTALALNDRPTTPSDVLVGLEWAYNDQHDCSNPNSGPVSAAGEHWTDATFSDAWLSGPAPLGYGNGNEATTLDRSDADPTTDGTQRRTTVYFRRTFQVADPAKVYSLDISVLRDDGAVVYINGHEVFRSNMPSGPIDCSTFAANGVGGSSETTFYTKVNVGGDVLVPGANIMAVEIHQATLTSSDLSFNAVVTAHILGSDKVILSPLEAEWSYSDDGTAHDYAGWEASDYDDSAWPRGNAAFGHGNNDIANTIINPGHTTHYFRRTFHVDDPSVYDILHFYAAFDDGYAVYINGFELTRVNLRWNSWQDLTFASKATTYRSGDEEFELQDSIAFKSAFLVPGENVIAVEVHQSSSTSNDAHFDCLIVGTLGAQPQPSHAGTFVPSTCATRPENADPNLVSLGPVAEGAEVVVGLGQAVVIDQQLPRLKSIVVQPGGKLVVADVPMTIDVDFIRVEANPTGSYGELHFGSLDCPITSGITVTFHGQRGDVDDMGTDTPPHSHGHKGMAIWSNAVVELHGVTAPKSWTRLASTAMAGDWSIQLAESVHDGEFGWGPGDRIVVVTTDYRATYGGSAHPDQTEEHIIQSVSADGLTVHLATPLQFMHWGADGEVGEVGLLSRRLKFQGEQTDGSELERGFGGHFLMRTVRRASITGVEFTRMGQAGVMGRYPVHWHLADWVEDATVEDCSIHHNNQRCVTIHGTSNVKARNNVCYSTNGHGYFLEDAAETYNTLDGNLAVQIRNVEGTFQLIPSDTKATGFWITNPNNTVINNVAADAHFGLWYAFHHMPTGPSLFLFAGRPEFEDLRRKPLLRSENNHAHSCERGVNIDHGPDENGNVDDSTNYTPRDPETGDSIEADFVDFKAWKNRDRGLWARGKYLKFVRGWMSSNEIGALTPNGPNAMVDCTFIGESPNYGLPPAGEARSRVNAYNINQEIAGFQNYDNGAHFVKGSTCSGFKTDSIREAGCITHLRATSPHDPTDSWITSTIDPDSDVLALDPQDLTKDHYRNFVNLDPAGSLSGVTGSWLLADMPFLLPPSHGAHDMVCGSVINHGRVCGPGHDNYIFIDVEDRDQSLTDHGTAALGYKDPKATAYHFGSAGANGHDIFNNEVGDYEFNMLAHHGVFVSFPHATPPKLEFSANRLAYNEWTVIAVKYPAGTTFTVNRFGSSRPAAQSLADLSVDTPWFFDAPYLYVMVVEQSTSDPKSTFVGASWYSGYDELDVDADCPAATGCWVTTSDPVPPVLPQTSNRALYSASLSCVGSETCSASSTAFAQLQPGSSSLQLSITHPFVDRDVSVEVSDGSSSTVLGSSTPVRDSMDLSLHSRIQLANGQMKVVIRVDGAVAMEGTLTCDAGSTCPAAPDVALNPDPCTTAVANAEPVLVDGALQTTWDFNGKWDATPELIAAADIDPAFLLCPSSSGVSKMTFTDSDGYIRLKTSECVHSLDLSQIKHLEFYLRTDDLAPGDALASLSLRITDGSEVHVSPQYISNGVSFGRYWSRVRIPLADLGVDMSASTFRAQYIYFYSDITDDFSVYVDNLQFVPESGLRRLRASAGSAEAEIAQSPAGLMTTTVPRRRVVRLYRGHEVLEDEE